MPRYLVTGGAGFLGRYVVEALAKDSYVAIYDSLDSVCGGDARISRIDGDVRDLNRLINTIHRVGADTIIHLAAYGRNLSCAAFPDMAWDVNVTGTKNVLEAARQLSSTIRRVVVCSSNIVLSDQPTVYKTTKSVAEQLVRLYATLGVSVIGLRPSNIYGKGQSKTEYQPCAFAGLDSGYKKDGYFTITGDGTQARDWVHASDVARAFKIIGERPALRCYAGSTFDICTGELTSMNQVATLLGVDIRYTDPRPGDAKVLISDPWPLSDMGISAQVKLQDAIWDAFPSVPRP